VVSESNACGIDSRAPHFDNVTKDFGSHKVEYPEYICRGEEKLKRLQKSLSRKQKGSKNYEKARLKLEKQQAYITNVRNDFLRKLSRGSTVEN